TDNDDSEETAHDAGTLVHEAGVLDAGGNARGAVLLDLAAQPSGLRSRQRAPGPPLLIPPILPRAPAGNGAPRPPAWRRPAFSTMTGRRLGRAAARTAGPGARSPASSHPRRARLEPRPR